MCLYINKYFINIDTPYIKWGHFDPFVNARVFASSVFLIFHSFWASSTIELFIDLTQEN